METTKERKLEAIAKLTTMQKCNEEEISNVKASYWKTTIVKYDNYNYAATILKDWKEKIIYIGIYYNLYKAKDLQHIEIISNEEYAEAAIQLIKKEITKGE